VFSPHLLTQQAPSFMDRVRSVGAPTTQGRAGPSSRAASSCPDDRGARALQEHPYEVPGISTRTITDGNPDYLAWIAQETAPNERLIE